FGFYATYSLGKAKSDTDGPETFPANSFDLSGEYGRSAVDVRHRFLFGGSINAPGKITLSPFVVAYAGLPYNITTGVDTNGDQQFTERPSFATDASRPGVVSLAGLLLDPNPAFDQQTIPRNFGNGPAFIIANLRLSKAISFGSKATVGAGTPGARSEKRFNLTFSLQGQNIFNRTNPNTPIGNMRSALFAKSNAAATAYSSGLGLGSTTAGNRRLEARVRFSF
ncbi:MAG: hypothetical protein DMF69_25130, partial [Acidobacteria bacterium]